MKKLFILSLIFISFNCDLLYSDPYGTALGSYNNITNYSNGNGGYVSNEYNYVNGTNTGMKWQCVEFVNRYYLVYYNQNIRIAGQNAVDYYPNAGNRGLISYPNGGTTSPALGDLLCFSGGNPNYGHVAIVREIGSNYLKVIQQNVSQSSSDANYTVNMTVSSGHYTVSGSTIGSGYVCQGWLRKSNSTVSVSFKFNGTELPAPPNEWKLWKYPPIPSNYYTLEIGVTNRNGNTYDVYLYRPNGDSIDVALNVNSDVLTQPFNVNMTNTWFPSSGLYRLKVFKRTTPRELWGTSQPFYISNIPTVSVDPFPTTMYVGQSVTIYWHISPGISTLPPSYGWINNAQIQMHRDTTALNVLGTPSVNSGQFTFTIPATIGPGYRVSVSNPAGTSIPPGYVFAYTNYFTISTSTGIEKRSEIIPIANRLYENYPNPFNPTTNINFDIALGGFVKIVIFDVLGQEISTLYEEELQAGSYKINWDANNCPSGVYFYRMQTGDFVQTKKLILMK